MSFLNLSSDEKREKGDKNVPSLDSCTSFSQSLSQKKKKRRGKKKKEEGMDIAFLRAEKKERSHRCLIFETNAKKGKEGKRGTTSALFCQLKNGRT